MTNLSVAMDNVLHHHYDAMEIWLVWITQMNRTVHVCLGYHGDTWLEAQVSWTETEVSKVTNSVNKQMV